MNPKAQKPRVFGMMNVYYRDPETGECDNQVGIATQASLDLLKRNLSHRAGRGDPVLSEEWSDFLYGDVTDPTTGLTAFVRETPLENNPMIKFAGIHFSTRSGYLDGSRPWPIELDTEEGQAILAGRYNIQDTDNVTRMRSYDDLLQYVVEDGEIPYDVIERACASFAPNGLPERRHNATVSAPATSPTQSPEEASSVSPVLSAIAPKEENIQPVVEDTEEEVSDDSIKQESQSEVSAEEISRHEALASKFKDDPNSLDPTELPEYFSLCGKLKVSPV